MSIEQILSVAASGDLAHYRPQAVIEAVNALLPLGKDGALAAIDSYLVKQDLQREPQEGLFLVLRVLFDVPAKPGYQPPMRLGGSAPPPPPTPQMLPHYPLVLVDDRPLLLISGYVLGGQAEPITEHIQYFRAHGTLRDQPLKPSEPPEKVLAEFQRLYQTAYGHAPPQHEMEWIKRQVGGK